MSVNINVQKEIHRNHKEESDIKLKTEETDRCKYVCTKKSYLRVHIFLFLFLFVLYFLPRS